MSRVVCSPYISLAGTEPGNLDNIHAKVYAKVVKTSYNSVAKLLTLDYEICDVSDPRYDPMIMGALWVEDLKDHIPVVLWDNQLWRVSNKVINELADILTTKRNNGH